MFKKCLVSVLILALSISMTLSFTPLASAKIKIRYAHWGANPELEAAIKAFNVSQDKIEVVFEPMADYTTKMIIQLAVGTAPQVFSTGYWAALPTWMRRGVLKDLTPLIERDKKELGLEDVPPMALKMCQYKGRYYAFPLRLNAGWGVWYNITMMKNAGLSEPTSNWTVNDFIDYALKLTIKDKKVYGTASISFDVARDHILQVLKGTFLYSIDGTRFLGDTAKVREGFAFVSNLLRKEIAPPRSLAIQLGPGGQPSFGFQYGNIGMQFVEVNAVVWVLVIKDKFEWNCVMPPRDPVTRKYYPQTIDPEFVSISATATQEETEAALEFIKFWSSEAGVKAAREGPGFLQLLPIHRKLMVKYFANPINPEAKKLNLKMWTSEMVNLVKYPMNVPAYNAEKIGDLLTNEYDKFWDGKITANQFLDTVTPKVNALLKEAKE